MSRLYSTTNWTGLTVGGIKLGVPTYLNLLGEVVSSPAEAHQYVWDDSRIPNGVIDSLGQVSALPEG